MKRTIAALVSVLAVGLLVLPLTASAAGTAGKWNGWITDELCGAKGAKAAHKDCAITCVKDKGSKFVLYNTADKKLYKLDKQDLAKKNLGHEVTVSGKIEGDSIAVDSIAAKAKT
ncbi:MAG TPA: DUF5818 domain-containing protein [Thermoanaerobaculia bacterium]|nr:DUF5818 domain-containing protein [Thermoanaerobaculia bacterium]